jgi:hypothetical protein
MTRAGTSKKTISWWPVVLVIVGICLALYGWGMGERVVTAAGVFLVMIGVIAIGRVVMR